MVAAGVTVVLDPVTVPMPWFREMEVAPLTLHASTEDSPGRIVEGAAVKEFTTGTGTAETATVTSAVELPAAFVAVRV